MDHISKGGTVVSRRRLLAGTAVATGSLYVATATGQLFYRTASEGGTAGDGAEPSAMTVSTADYPGPVTGFELGYNQGGANYYLGAPRRNNWGLYAEIRDGGLIFVCQSGITGTGTIKAPPGTMLSTGSPTIVIGRYDSATGSYAVNVTRDSSSERFIRWSGTKPAWIEVTRTGRNDGTSPEWLAAFQGDGLRDLDNDWTNSVALSGVTPRPVRGVDRNYPVTSVGCIEPFQDVVDSVRDLMAIRPSFRNYWHVIAPDLTDAMMEERATYWRDQLPTRTRIVLEWCNEWPWNQPFSGPKRVLLDALRGGWYGPATYGNPQPPLTITPVVNPDGTGVGLSPATPAGGLIAYLKWGIGFAVWRARRPVAAGADITVGDDWEILPDIDGGRSSRIWGSIRFMQLLQIVRRVFGEERYEAQVFPVRMGQAANETIADQMQVEKTFVPGFWKEIKGLGVGGYWSPDETVATNPGSIIASFKARMPAFFDELRMRYAQALAEGKVFCQYEFAAGPGNEHEYYFGKGLYTRTYNFATRSEAMRPIMADMAAFRKQFAGIFMYFTLTGQEPWSLKTSLADTDNPKWLGWQQGLASGYVPTIPIPPPSPPAAAPLALGPTGYRYFRITPKKAGGIYGQTPQLRFYSVGAGGVALRNGTTPYGRSGWSVATESTTAYRQNTRNLLDDDPATGWQTAIGGAVNAGRFTIDTGEGVGVTPTWLDLRAHPGGDDFNVNSCIVDASRDGTTWVQLANVALDSLRYAAGTASVPLTYPV